MFSDRQDAGRKLADAVKALGLPNPVVLALPRGGVPVAVPVAKRLGAPLDLLLVRKVGVPGNEELAAGAVVNGEGRDVVYNREILRGLGLTEADFVESIRSRLKEIETRRQLYLQGRDPVSVAGRSAIVVDDGIATGATVRAALKALRRRGPQSITLAVPVAPPEVLDEMRRLVDHLVCLHSPKTFYAVGADYRDFGQTSDEEVIALMKAASGKT